MDLLTYDWHPAWISYEWWRDIGLPIAGAIASTVVGGAAVIVAMRGHRLAELTTEFSKKVREEEESRRGEDAKREEQRQRAEFATQARAFAVLLRQFKTEGSPTDFDDVENSESELRDVAITLDANGDAEHLLERMKAHFSETLFPKPRNSGSAMGGLWHAWRQANDDIRAYVQHKPLSEPHWMETSREDPNRVTPVRLRPGQEGYNGHSPAPPLPTDP